MHILIVGSGAAGLMSAIKAAENNFEVTLVTKAADINNSASACAQGGIAGLGINDSQEKFYKDIMRATAGLARPEAVKILVSEGPKIIKNELLKKIKTGFTTGKNSLPAYTREAAHSARRILYSGDQTGDVIIKSLAAYAVQLKNIKIITDCIAVDLITIPHNSSNPLSIYRRPFCLGAYLFSSKKRKITSCLADRVILAAGGIGQIYKYTTNPEISTGDGIAMAYRAGARIINMEFTQFHPTAMSIKGSSCFLISEAVRGEGGILVNSRGRDFTRKYDHRGSLAPRDIVTRAVISELEHSSEDTVYLSLEKIPPDIIRKRFPNIMKKCLEFKIDPVKDPIPVMPAFHFLCGGILTDLWGAATLPNLYAVGECACTGVHGANRLASTSLLECLTFACRAVEHIKNNPVTAYTAEGKEVRPWLNTGTVNLPDPVLLRQDWATLKSIMWNYVGIIRTRKRLNRALNDLRNLQKEVDNFYRNTAPHEKILELRNAIQTSILVASAAAKNDHSTGCHYKKNDQ
ncbi:MAG: L-aspartate oxidase [Spirochaetes bacterium GWF1_41_5]|nr:MAG: L-aspartate oxidase [Spirochaetes bacterium GWF1_41_5]